MLTLTAALSGLAAMPPIASSVPRAQAAVFTGRVVDVKRAALPGVTVTAMPGAGGPTARTTTDIDGRYGFEALPDGTYRLDFDLYGFDMIRRNNVRMQAGNAESVRVDATLVIGAVCECVQQARRIGLRERDGRVVDQSGRPLGHARLEIVVLHAARWLTPTRTDVSAFASP